MCDFEFLILVFFTSAANLVLILFAKIFVYKNTIFIMWNIFLISPNTFGDFISFFFIALDTFLNSYALQKCRSLLYNNRISCFAKDPLVSISYTHYTQIRITYVLFTF